MEDESDDDKDDKLTRMKKGEVRRKWMRYYRLF